MCLKVRLTAYSSYNHFPMSECGSDLLPRVIRTCLAKVSSDFRRRFSRKLESVVIEHGSTR